MQAVSKTAGNEYAGRKASRGIRDFLATVQLNLINDGQKIPGGLQPGSYWKLMLCKGRWERGIYPAKTESIIGGDSFSLNYLPPAGLSFLWFELFILGKYSAF